MTLTTDTLAARPNQNIPSLDGLRAISVMLVLCAHFINEKLFPGGMGVDIFFVISGFLISRLMLAEGKATGRISLPRFYTRRALRLLPVVVAFTGLMVAIYLIFDKPIDWWEPAAAIFYFANYLYAPIPGGAVIPLAHPLVVDPHLTMPFVPLWSLSVEEHFYLLTPATLMVLKRRPASLILAMVAVCVACLGYRMAMAASHPDLLATNFFHFRTECRIDLLAMGVILACLCEMEIGRAWLESYAKTPLLVAGLIGLLLCLLIRGEVFRQTWRYTIEGVSIVFVISSVLISGGWIASVLNHSALRFMGRLSYSLYVWSLFGSWVAGFAPKTIWLRSPLEFAVTGTCALASYFLLERPLVKWRQRLAARPAPVAAQQAWADISRTR